MTTLLFIITFGNLVLCNKDINLENGYDQQSQEDIRLEGNSNV